RFDVSVVRLSHPPRYLVYRFHQLLAHELPLEPTGPVHDIGHADVRIDPGRVSAGEVGTDEGRAAIGGDVEWNRAGSLRQPEGRAWVADGRLDRGRSQILLEVLAQAGHE